MYPTPSLNPLPHTLPTPPLNGDVKPWTGIHKNCCSFFVHRKWYWNQCWGPYNKLSLCVFFTWSADNLVLLPSYSIKVISSDNSNINVFQYLKMLYEYQAWTVWVVKIGCESQQHSPMCTWVDHTCVYTWAAQSTHIIANKNNKPWKFKTKLYIRHRRTW